MKFSYCSALALVLSLVGCATETAPVSGPLSHHYLVVGNDRGLRNEFIDVANVVRLGEGDLTVWSVADTAYRVTYPVRDSLLLGPPGEVWRLRQPTPDTLLLLDSAKNNRYYLVRLRPWDPPLDLVDLLTGVQFTDEDEFRTTTLAFEGDGTATRNCLITHGTTHRSDPGPQPVHHEDGYWRVDRRFGRPLLLTTRKDLHHYVTVIDSVGQDYGVAGWQTINSQPIPARNRRHLRPVPVRYTRDSLRNVLSRLEDATATTASWVTGAGKRRWRASTSPRDLTGGIVVADFEIDQLRLLLADDRYAFTTGDRTFRSGTFRLHGTLPYLILDEGCSNENFLTVDSLTERALVVSARAVVLLPDVELGEVDIGVALPDRTAYHLDRLTFTIPVRE